MHDGKAPRIRACPLPCLMPHVGHLARLQTALTSLFQGSGSVTQVDPGTRIQASLRDAILPTAQPGSLSTAGLGAEGGGDRTVAVRFMSRFFRFGNKLGIQKLWNGFGPNPSFGLLSYPAYCAFTKTGTRRT